MWDEQQAPGQGEACYRRFLAGDVDAFEELVGLYRGGLTLFLARYVQDDRAVEELVIDTFAELALAGGRFRGASGLKTYLYAIGRNLARKYLKARRREVQFDPADIEALAGDPAAGEGVFADGTLPEEAFLRTERHRTLYAALRALPPGYGDALFLLYFEEMTYAQAARVLKKREGQMAGLVHRAKEALRKELEGRGVTWP